MVRMLLLLSPHRWLVTELRLKCKALPSWSSQDGGCQASVTQRTVVEERGHGLVSKQENKGVCEIIFVTISFPAEFSPRPSRLDFRQPPWHSCVV